MNIQLPTGNTIVVSVYEFLFVLKEEDVDLFYQNAIADDDGVYIDNPFSNKGYRRVIETDDIIDIEDIPNIQEDEIE